VRKLSTYAWTVIFLTIIFSISMGAAAYYYYGIPQPTQLRILHTHSDKLVSEIVNDFKTWYQQQHGHPIEVTTTQTDPQTAYATVTNPYTKPEADIWWGGPLRLFEDAHDMLLPYNSTNINQINTTCHFCPLMDLKENHTAPDWYAASLHGLGVMYNEHVLEMIGLQKPQTWTDLLEEAYKRNVTMVNPGESEAVSTLTTLILQRKNWTNGWEYLLKLAASIENYDISEADSALKVASGYMPLTIVPDFYAYDKMAISVPNITFTYLDATVLEPDPIAIIWGGTYWREAQAFIDYILTQQAQNIIGKYYLPIRQDANTVLPRINPFDEDFPYIRDYNETFQQIGEDIITNYYQVWIAEEHDQIKTVWKEIVEANKTKGVNENATRYYDLAWSNFTYAGYYLNRTQIDTIYDVTAKWTNATKIAAYIDQWRANSTKAYSDALTNAQKSKQSAAGFGGGYNFLATKDIEEANFFES